MENYEQSANFILKSDIEKKVKHMVLKMEKKKNKPVFDWRFHVDWRILVTMGYSDNKQSNKQMF